MTIRAWAWSNNFTSTISLKCDVYDSIKAGFAKDGVELPYPYKLVVMKETFGDEENVDHATQKE